jgi:hypothetical protein
MNRAVMKPFALSDGTYIPKGVWISTPSEAQNFDPEIFGEDAEEFKPFRYLDDTRDDLLPVFRQSITTTCSSFLLFGHGRHGWYVSLLQIRDEYLLSSYSPGRFFAAYEVKAIIAYILLRYDMEFTDEALKKGGVVPVKWLGMFNLLDESVKMTFRRRDLREVDGS